MGEWRSSGSTLIGFSSSESLLSSISIYSAFTVISASVFKEDGGFDAWIFSAPPGNVSTLTSFYGAWLGEASTWVVTGIDLICYCFKNFALSFSPNKMKWFFLP